MIHYMRKLSRRAIKDRSSINQSLLSAMKDSSRDKPLTNGLIDRLGTCINHDKEVRVLFCIIKLKNRLESDLLMSVE